MFYCRKKVTDNYFPFSEWGGKGNGKSRERERGGWW
jgi:hypothetical protein